MKKSMSRTRRKEYSAKNLRTIGVRFPTDPGIEYTYLVKESDDVYLGMELVVKSKNGELSKVCYCTRINDGVVMPADYDGELKQVTKRVVDL